MRHLKALGLASIVVSALLALIGSGTASATELTCGSSMCAVGTSISAQNEGPVIFHTAPSDVLCSGSTIGSTTANTGSASETVSANVSTLTFTGCGSATVKVIQLGSIQFHTQTTSANNNGTLTSNGFKMTIEVIGVHCEYETSNTDVGTVTGSATTGGNATLDLEAVVPHTGGRSGAFCGASAVWTAAYKITSPSPLNVD